MKQLSILYRTSPDLSGLVLRLTLAIVLLPHGCQLLLGWFGGYGFTNTMNYLTQNEGLPWLVAFSVILLQFFGSIAILLGIGGRLFGFALSLLFIGMIVTSHWSHGFFMNWYGTQSGEGFEYHLLAIGLSLAIMIKGSGAWSLDLLLSQKQASASHYLNLVNVHK